MRPLPVGCLFLFFFTSPASVTRRFLLSQGEKEITPQRAVSEVTNMEDEKRQPSNRTQAGVRRLPRVKIRDKVFFQDNRLREFRNVINPHDRITFEEYRQKNLWKESRFLDSSR